MPDITHDTNASMDKERKMQRSAMMHTFSLGEFLFSLGETCATDTFLEKIKTNGMIKDFLLNVLFKVNF